MPEDLPARVAFYDSGVGGLPYLKRAKELLPGAAFSYLADSRNFPLGEKPREKVETLVREAVERLMAASSPDMVVIACNTASVMALDGLRAAWPSMTFVGTVPAVKPAVARTRTGRVAVIATARTVESTYMVDLIARYSAGKEVYSVAAPDWVEFVETEWLASDPVERRAVVAPVVEPLLDRGVDVIVLACTHFLYLSDEISAVSGSRASVIDSSDGVARRIADLASSLHDGRNLAGAGEKGSCDLWSSAPAPRIGEFAVHFGLEYRGLIP